MSFIASLSQTGSTTTITLEGDLDNDGADVFHEKLEEASTGEVARLVLDLTHLDSVSSAGLRALTFCRQKLGDDVDIVVVSPSPSVRRSLEQVDLQQSVSFTDRVPS
jgi:anti-sigma B factor antagonist